MPIKLSIGGQMRRGAVDFVIGFAIFLATTVAFAIDSAVPFAQALEPRLAAQPDRLFAMVLLAVVFSAFFAFNMGLWRHLGRAAVREARVRSTRPRA